MKPLLADQLWQDERVQQAHALLQSAQDDYQRQLVGPRDPDPQREAVSTELLNRLAAARGAPTWYPYLGSGFGAGALVELVDGSVKYDCISGIGVHGWGHGHPALRTAQQRAALSDVVMQGHLQQNAITLDVSERILSLARRGGLGCDHVLLTTSGAMANENALKIAFQARAPATRILAFSKNFAGRSLGLASVSDKPQYRDGLPAALSVDYLPFCKTDDIAGSTAACLRHLDRIAARYPGQHACIMAELVQGEGGFYPGHHDFFRALFTRCRELGICVIADEIQTFGRLPGGPFASAHFGIADLVDIVTVGKVTQVCATIYRSTLQPRPGLVSQTFTGGTQALHAAAVILQQMEQGDLYGETGRIARLGSYFREHLQRLVDTHPDRLSGPFGSGMMIACTPYGGEKSAVLALCKRLFTAGVIAFVAGADPMRLRFLMPFAAISEQDIDAVVTILEACLLTE